ncbi:uncharacterized protein L3040_003791 [Drepanopeziza brunnea f. sp. 'multigermtubi']|uniref:uncharacterized protein n=1 Tax=Drepanopeziza brunnea f. sp. 'multigermtubi' TaxID=698441 RepID=UPI00238B9218|nr:hypothetical protein L3040_003791 [Drepanopeziza brunnea f. sp. 'multigermtubi']
MSSANGLLSSALAAGSSNATPLLSAKRKRDDALDGQNDTNEVPKSMSSGLQKPSAEASRALIRDLIDVMKADDTTPSILSRSLPSRPSSSGPQAKRQKSEENSETSTSILERHSANTYNNVTEVLNDIDAAVADIMDKLELPDGAARNQFIPVSATHSEISMKVNAFKQRAHELIARELVATDSEVNDTVNGSARGAARATGNKMVLTLYGTITAPNPKQLFSSLQIPTKIKGEDRAVLQTLREAGLPNGITATQVVPFEATGLAEDKKPVPTLGELFPTPSTVPALQPPKPSKVATTRSSNVGWYQPCVTEPVSRSASYFKQAISTGQWLDYSKAFPPQQGVKRKQRDRALSFGGSKTPASESDSAESEALKLEALFRGAYSNFAPVKDDSAAVAPTGIMNRLWWQELGERSFEKMVENWDNNEQAMTPGPALKNSEVVDDDEEYAMFAKAIEAMGDDPIDPSLGTWEAAAEKSAEEKDVDEIIEGISELLETLNSYQRIRHMSLNASNRPAGLLSAPDTTALGTPSKPSESEQATYEILKSQLTLMIASLPPFAVAKLDPDRLADLAISTKIEVQSTNYQGVMEEDEASARAKAAALAAATAASRPAVPATMHRTSSSSLYGNQYAPSPRPVPAATQQYYNSQTPIRPPPTNMQRPPATAPVPYQIQKPPGSAPYRPGAAYNTPTYPHQAPRPVQQQQYAPSNQQQQYQPANGQNFNQNFMRASSQNYQSQMAQPVSQAAHMNGRYTSQPQATYAHQTHQAQPMSNGMGYQYANGTNLNRQTSPQKMYSPQPQHTQLQNTQSRVSYSTPTPAPSIAQNRQPYMQNAMGQAPMMNGSVSQAPQQQEQQSSMMDRQRAQLAQQQTHAQQAARISAQASAIGSPQKANGVAAGL